MSISCFDYAISTYGLHYRSSAEGYNTFFIYHYRGIAWALCCKAPTTWLCSIDCSEYNEISHQSSESHYDDVIMTMLASQITSLPVVCSIVYSDVNQRKHQSSASLAFVREIHRGPVNFPHKWPVTRKMFPFDDVIMIDSRWQSTSDH